MDAKLEETAMKIDGSCHCGALTFEAEIDPDGVSVCHCTDCQSMSGTAFRTVVRVSEEDFTMLSGRPKTYVKIAASGAEREMAFCENCGSQIYGTNAGEGPKVYGLRVGTIRQSRQLSPKRQIWNQSAQPWLSVLDSLPRIEQG